MRIGTKQASGVTRHDIPVTDCSELESAPENTQEVYQATVAGKEHLEGLRSAIDDRRRTIADVPSAEMTSEHYAEMLAISEAEKSAMVAELKYREEQLEMWHIVLSDFRNDLQSRYYAAWEAETARVRKGLEKLGYDMSDPRQAGVVLFHPAVKAAKLNTDSMRGGSVVQNARAANQKAIESLHGQLDALRDKAMKV